MMKTKQMKVVDNKLYMSKWSLEELGKKYGTPLYVYDEEGIDDRIKTYINSFKSDKFNTHVVYATKAFLCPYLCNIMKKYGVWADAVSLGDMAILEKSGFPFSHIVLHGNNKTLEELEYAVKNEVGYIVVDNLSELLDLVDIAGTLNKKVKTLLRVNPGVSAHTHEFIQTATMDSKFGESIYDDARIEEIINIYKENKYVTLDGFHAHIGSQISDEESFTKLVHVMAKFIKDIHKKYKLDIHTIDYGGGFGVKYLDSDKEIDVKRACLNLINETIKEYENSDILIDTLMIEPGRSIVGDNCVTVYESRRTKLTYAGVRYAFIDGGMPDNIRPALYDALYTVENASRVEGTKVKYNVVGKCCESGDIIAKGVNLTEVKQGDTLCVYTTGAYSYSMSMNYNGLTRPACIFVSSDKISVAVRRETTEDLMKTFEL